MQYVIGCSMQRIYRVNISITRRDKYPPNKSFPVIVNRDKEVDIIKPTLIYKAQTIDVAK